jgi:Ser-tRNA(Ala) deacylase AlaX
LEHIIVVVSQSTVPLYAEDSRLREFDAFVTRSGPKFVVLDRTAFYPEGGGQPSDIGVLITEGRTVKVIKSMKRGNEIFHYLDSDIKEGTLVHGLIDWDERSWNMRRHSAEHLLTGLIEAENVQPKVYSDLEKLEYVDSGITTEKLKQIELLFNRIIEQDEPVKIYYVKRSTLDVSNDPRKRNFLEKIPRNMETLRMVDIGSHASTFCFGTHVESTSEIGKLLSLTMEEKKKGRQIISFQLKKETKKGRNSFS